MMPGRFRTKQPHRPPDLNLEVRFEQELRRTPAQARPGLLAWLRAWRQALRPGFPRQASPRQTFLRQASLRRTSPRQTFLRRTSPRQASGQAGHRFGSGTPQAGHTGRERVFWVMDGVGWWRRV